MTRHKPGGSGRGARVAEQIHHDLAEMIRGELKDPRVGLVTITGVDLTADYAYATVWFSVFPDDEKTLADTLEGLQRSAGFLRSLLFRRIRIHTTPQLRFAHDPSVERGASMSALIDEAIATQGKD